MKRTAAAILAVLLLAVCLSSASQPGSVTDPLISKSYVDGSFVPDTVSELKAEGEAALEQMFAEITGEGGAAPDGTVYDFASGYTEVELAAGGSIKLWFGSSVILVSGSASITPGGTVVNVASASELTEEAALEAGKRYFCAENTTAAVAAASRSTFLVNGYFAAEGETSGESGMNYTDVSEKNWFYQYVKYVVDNGLYYDIDGETFRPNEYTTRATLVYALWSAAGRPEAEGAAKFSDVGDDWYTEAVVWATSTGVVKGYDDGTFKPDGNVTREQIAALIHRYSKWLGREDGEPGDLTAFGDEDKVGKWALDDVKWAVGEGLIKGNDKKMLNPKASATRAEVAAILMRFLEE